MSMNNKTKDSGIDTKMIKKNEYFFLSKFPLSKKTRIAEVLRMRLKGRTLQEIGDKYGFTRERARQLETQGIRILERCS